MIKQALTFLFLSALLVQTFSNALIVLDFYANRTYIAQTLCENRSKPQLNCCGKCQLNKRLKQESRKDRQNPERKTENRNEVLPDTVIGLIPRCACNTLATTYPPYREKSMPPGVLAVLFHPPCLA